MSYTATRGEYPCWTPERRRRAVPEGNRPLHIIIVWHLTWVFLFFAAVTQLGCLGSLLDSPARLQNETMSFVEHLESHTVLACNSNQDSEPGLGRKRMDCYLLVWWRCCLQKKFKVISPCKKWKGVSNWNAFTSANSRQRNRNPGAPRASRSGQGRPGRIEQAAALQETLENNTVLYWLQNLHIPYLFVVTI